MTAVVSLVDDDYLPADGSAHVVAVQYLLDQQALCAATSNGNLLLWNVTFAQVLYMYNTADYSPFIELFIKPKSVCLPFLTYPSILPKVDVLFTRNVPIATKVV